MKIQKGIEKDWVMERPTNTTFGFPFLDLFSPS
jgi:hypothetical protein